MDRRLGTAIILNILNLLDLVLTLIGTQMSHIDFINVEQNDLFVNAYIKFLAGDWNPIMILIIIKILIGLFFAIFLLYFERCFLFSIIFGLIFAFYSVAQINWILLIFQAEPMSPLAIDWTLICLFVMSFLIYYSPSELKKLFWDRIFNRSKMSLVQPSQKCN